LRARRGGRDVKVAVRGEGLVSHAGAALIAETADRLGLTGALAPALVLLRERTSGHSPAAMVRDLAVMFADGGDARCDLGALRDQEALFGAVASDSTAYRPLERIAADSGALERIRAARARRRGRGRGGAARGWR
jgi:DDE family transposase